MIYLVGGSGGPNFGDELILLKWVAAYRAAGFEDEIVVDCKSVSQSLRLHGRREDRPSAGQSTALERGAFAHPLDHKVRFVHVIKSLTKGRGGLFSEHVERGRTLVRESLAMDGGLSASTEGDPVDLSGCRIVHMIGGGYINGVWPNSGAVLGACAQLSEELRIPAVATGLGLAPLPSSILGDREVTAAALSRLSLFECRDQASKAGLEDAGIAPAQLRLGVDDAYLGEAPVDKSEGPRTLHLSTFEKHLPHFASDDSLPRLKALAQHYDRCAFWVCGPSDEPMVAPLRKALGPIEVYDLSQLLFGTKVLRANDGMLTSRFHPHLLAARAGLGGHYFAASDFYREKHGALLQLGSPFTDWAKVHEPARPLAGTSTIARADAAHREHKRRVAREVFALAAIRGAPKDDAPHSTAPRSSFDSLVAHAAHWLDDAKRPALRRLSRGLARVRSKP